MSLSREACIAIDHGQFELRTDSHPSEKAKFLFSVASAINNKRRNAAGIRWTPHLKSGHPTKGGPWDTLDAIIPALVPKLASSRNLTSEKLRFRKLLRPLRPLRPSEPQNCWDEGILAFMLNP